MNEETLRALPPQELIAQLIRQLGVAQATELRARDWGLVVGNPSRWEVRRPLLEVGDFVIFARFPDHLTARERALSEGMEHTTRTYRVPPGTPAPTDSLRILESRPEAIRRMILELEEIEQSYYELIYNVARVFPGESRHQTALRYIQQAEANAVSGPACEAKP